MSNKRKVLIDLLALSEQEADAVIDCYQKLNGKQAKRKCRTYSETMNRKIVTELDAATNPKERKEVLKMLAYEVFGIKSDKYTKRIKTQYGKLKCI